VILAVRCEEMPPEIVVTILIEAATDVVAPALHANDSPPAITTPRRHEHIHYKRRVRHASSAPLVLSPHPYGRSGARAFPWGRPSCACALRMKPSR